MLVEVAEELQREILEGECRPVKELEDEQVLAQLFERGDRGMGEMAVGTRDELLERGWFHIGREPAEKLVAEIRVAQPREIGQFAREIRQGFRQEQAAVGGEAGRDRRGEAERFRLPAGG